MPHLVLVADARNAKLFNRQPSGELDELWSLDSFDDRVRSFGESLDTREAPTTPDTLAASSFADGAFVAEISQQLIVTCGRIDIESILVIAPLRFVDLLDSGLSSAIWCRVRQVVPRDETALNDKGLRKLVDETVAQC